MLISSFVIGGYFCYDSPGLLYSRLQELYGLSASQQSLLYSIYSLPNVIVPLFAGILFETPGKVPMLLITLILVCVGQWMVAFAGSNANYY